MVRIPPTGKNTLRGVASMVQDVPVSELRAEFLGMSIAEAAAVVQPYVVREVTDWADWRALTRPVYRSVVLSAIKRAVFGVRDPRFSRTETQVVERYSQKWIDRSVAERAPSGTELPVIWGDRRLVVDSRGVRRLRIARLMRLIEQIRPRHVLDVGCGNGESVLLLACRFADVQFHGLELTPGGVAAAHAVQRHVKLPSGLVELSPEPLRDFGAHRTIRFQQGSAKSLPFGDGSIDLVFTSQAIEQMQSIKDQVLAEIGRVSAKYASFFEAFRDFNRGPIQRLYIYAKNYFRGEVAELRRIGFREIAVATDLPQKPWMNNVHALAAK